jgi:hypothetical protein
MHQHHEINREEIIQALEAGWTFIVKYNKSGYTMSATKETESSPEVVGKNVDLLMIDTLKYLNRSVI